MDNQAVDTKSKSTISSKASILKLIIVILIVIVLFSAGFCAYIFFNRVDDTPFDRVNEHIMSKPKLEETIALLGQPDNSNDFDTIWSISYNNWEGFGYKGHMSFVWEQSSVFPYSINFSHAVWVSEKNINSEKMAKEIIKIMDKKYGSHTQNKGEYYWYDIYGTEFMLDVRSDADGLSVFCDP